MVPNVTPVTFTRICVWSHIRIIHETHDINITPQDKMLVTLEGTSCHVFLLKYELSSHLNYLFLTLMLDLPLHFPQLSYIPSYYKNYTNYSSSTSFWFSYFNSNLNVFWKTVTYSTTNLIFKFSSQSLMTSIVFLVYIYILIYLLFHLTCFRHYPSYFNPLHLLL